MTSASDQTWMVYHGGCRASLPAPTRHSKFRQWLSPNEQDACHVQQLERYGVTNMKHFFTSDRGALSWAAVCRNVPALQTAFRASNTHLGPIWFQQLQGWFRHRQHPVSKQIWALPVTDTDKRNAGWREIVRLCATAMLLHVRLLNGCSCRWLAAQCRRCICVQIWSLAGGCPQHNNPCVLWWCRSSPEAKWNRPWIVARYRT